MNATYLIAFAALLVSAVVLYRSIATTRQKSANARELDELRSKQDELNERLAEAERRTGTTSE